LKGSDWAIFGKSNVSVAIMGNIGYPIDNHWYDNSDITSALSCGIEIDFNIGDLEISASREKLQYTDRTKSAIKNKLIRIVKEVSDDLNSRFKNCATYFDACKLYGTIVDYGSNLYVLRNMVKSSLTFKGNRITGSNIRFNNTSDFNVRHYDFSFRGQKVRSCECNQIVCDDKTVLIHNDLSIASGINNRVYNLVSAGKRVYVLSGNPAGKAAFFAETNLEDSNFTLLSSYPKVSLASNPNYAKNSKHSSKEFVFDFSLTKNWSHKRSEFWQTENVDIENDSGVYVVINSFLYSNESGNFCDPWHLRETINNLSVFGIKIPKIYGFKIAKKQEVEKNKNMVLVWDYINKELLEYFNQNKIAQKVADRLEYDNNANPNWFYFLNYCMNSSKSKISKNTLFSDVAEKYAYMMHKADQKVLENATKYSHLFKSTCTPKHDLKDAIEKVESKYPLFKHIYWGTINDYKDIVEYVNSIDG